VDPEMLKGEKTMFQLRCHLSQMQIANQNAFYTGKRLTEKNMRPYASSL